MQPEQTPTSENTETKPAPEARVVDAPKKEKKMPRQRHFLAVFFISFMWGTVGIDRMYLGKWLTGFLKLITFGGFGLWTLVDFVIIMNGSMHDKQDREMLQFAEYKKFAGRTVLLFAVILGLVILANGLLLIYAVSQLAIQLQDGGGILDQINQIPGLKEQLQQNGVDPSQLDSLNL